MLERRFLVCRDFLDISTTVTAEDCAQTVMKNLYAEQKRTEILANLLGIVQRGAYECEKLYELRDSALIVENNQWETAVNHVMQRLAH